MSKGSNTTTNSTISSPSNTQSALSRKISKLLETRTDSKDVQIAIDNLGPLINYGKNNLNSRRNLRSNIEKKGIENNMLFLASFMEVQRNLEELQREVSQMSSSCNQMLDRLLYTKDISGSLLHQAQLLHNQRYSLSINRLKGNRKKNEMELEISLVFLKKFQLSESELISLRGYRFFLCLMNSALHQVRGESSQVLI